MYKMDFVRLLVAAFELDYDSAFLWAEWAWKWAECQEGLPLPGVDVVASVTYIRCKLEEMCSL